MAWTTPKTDWTTGELVSASDMNAIGENLAALRSLSATAAVYTTTRGIEINSNTFVDVDRDNLNLTVTTAGGDVLVHFHGSVHLNRAEGVYFDVDVDGSRQGGSDGILRSYFNAYQSGDTYEALSFTRLIQNLSAGSHTFKLQWKTRGTVPLRPGAQFWVREI